MSIPPCKAHRTPFQRIVILSFAALTGITLLYGMSLIATFHLQIPLTGQTPSHTLVNGITLIFAGLGFSLIFNRLCLDTRQWPTLRKIGTHYLSQTLANLRNGNKILLACNIMSVLQLIALIIMLRYALRTLIEISYYGINSVTNAEIDNVASYSITIFIACQMLKFMISPPSYKN